MSRGSIPSPTDFGTSGYPTCLLLQIPDSVLSLIAFALSHLLWSQFLSCGVPDRAETWTCPIKELSDLFFRALSQLLLRAQCIYCSNPALPSIFFDYLVDVKNGCQHLGFHGPFFFDPRYTPESCHFSPHFSAWRRAGASGSQSFHIPIWDFNLPLSVGQAEAETSTLRACEKVWGRVRLLQIELIWLTQAEGKHFAGVFSIPQTEPILPWLLPPHYP